MLARVLLPVLLAVLAGIPSFGAAQDAQTDLRKRFGMRVTGAVAFFLSQDQLDWLDGKVHAENSSFYSVLFARHSLTSLDLWNVEIGLSVVCGNPLDVRLDKTTEIACTSCDLEKSSTACRLDRAPSLTVNPCQSFEGNLPACEPPLPTRHSPYIPMPPRLRQ